MDLCTPKSHFEDKLFMKYFNNNFQDTDAVLLKLYPIHNDNFNEKIDQGNQSKRRALSPKPITAYLRVNKDAFLNKREGILNPNIKLKIIEMKIRNKEKLKTLNKRNIQNDKNLCFNTLRRRNDDNHSYLSTKKEKKKSNILNLKEPLFKFKNSKGFIPYGFKYDANKNKNNSKRDDAKNEDDIKSIESSREKRENFIANMFKSNKYIRRIEINSTFSKFENLISEEEILKYSQKIWKEAHSYQ